MRDEAFQPENFSCSMFAKNLDGVYLWVNQALLTKHRLKIIDIVGKTDKDLPWATHSKVLRRNDEEVVDEGLPKVFKETASRDGLIVKGYVQKSPAIDENGKIVGLTGVWIDVPSNHSLLLAFSLREKQCLEDIVSGKSSRESAERLGLSRRTVESYIENIKNKLNCKNKSELIIKYYESLNS
jgi:DNA-binding CsgD family transcriptional regulator